MNLISSKLKSVLNEHGPDNVLLLDYSGNTGLITSQLSLRIGNALGVTHTDHAICSRSGHEALRLHYGLSHGISPETLPDKKMITFWGFNARVSSIHQWALAMKARLKGAKIAVIDPRFCESAEAADLWVRPKPGSDVALAYGVARCIIEKGKTDDSFIQNFTIGYESYLKEVMSWSPSKVTSVTGVKWENVEALAELMTDSKTTMPLKEAFIARVKSLHSYTVPEIIALPISAGLPVYLEWIRTSVRR